MFSHNVPVHNSNCSVETWMMLTSNKIYIYFKFSISWKNTGDMYLVRVHSKWIQITNIWRHIEHVSIRNALQSVKSVSYFNNAFTVLQIAFNVLHKVYLRSH